MKVIKKIAIIAPRPFSNSYNLFKMPPLGPLTIATVLKEAGYSVRMHDENIKPVYDEHRNKLSQSITEADAIGIYSVSSNANRGYLIADEIRKINPDVHIVFGGPHASSLPEEALKHGDSVVIGEGELVIPDIFKNRTKGVVQGKQVMDMDSLPFVDFTLNKDSKMSKYVPISTSRGCPFACSFCSVSKVFGKEYRYRSAESVFQELQMHYKRGHKYFYFCDDNFTANKKRVMSLFDKILQSKMKIQWMAEVRTNISKDEDVIELAAKTGCKCMLIGMESPNPNTLASYNKKQTPDDIENTARMMHKHGIAVHGMFIFGADADTMASADETIAFCKKLGLESAQFSVLFPIPGTDLNARINEENRIFTKNWDLYDGGHIVFQPKNMTALQVQFEYMRLWKGFYSWGYVLRRSLKNMFNKLIFHFVVKYEIKKFKKQNKAFLKQLKAMSAGAELKQ